MKRIPTWHAGDGGHGIRVAFHGVDPRLRTILDSWRTEPESPPTGRAGHANLALNCGVEPGGHGGDIRDLF